MGEFFAKNVNLFWNIGKVGRGCFGLLWRGGALPYFSLFSKFAHENLKPDSGCKTATN